MNTIETSSSEDPNEQDAILAWESAHPELAAGDRLVVDVEGFEGPLDLLLALARTQKVDLAKISVLALAQQYLDFIAEARRLRLEIAADYLVMAAWLAFLKSKLLLPAEPSEEGEPSGAELAALLASGSSGSTPCAKLRRN
jgi:segregation and condensation protein A